MPVNPVYHTYASVQEFKIHLAGSGYVDAWTQDERTIRRILEGASRLMDTELGGRSWGPRIETRVYDLGTGHLRTSAAYQPLVNDSRLLGPVYQGLSIILLDDWLLTPTTVTAYSDSARTTSQTLTEGYAADYLLEPYNSSPKHTLKLTENTTKTLSAGQQTLSIAGVWGWQNVRAGAGTLAAALSDTTGTTVTMTAGHAVETGNTILVDSEQMYVAAVAGNSLTVVRGVNGTTAATHLTSAAVSVYQHPADVVECCLAIARSRYREKDAGQGEQIGEGGIVLMRPGAAERAELKKLRNAYAGSRARPVIF